MIRCAPRSSFRTRRAAPTAPARPCRQAAARLRRAARAAARFSPPRAAARGRRVHERPEMLRFTATLVGALENVEQRLPAFGASKRAEMLHRARLEIRIAAAGDLDDDLTRFGRSVLREHIQRTLLEAWRAGAVDDLLEHRNGTLLVGAREAVERHQPQLFVRHVFRLTGCPAAWRISTSSARASVTQRLSGTSFASGPAIRARQRRCPACSAPRRSSTSPRRRACRSD